MRSERFDRQSIPGTANLTLHHHQCAARESAKSCGRTELDRTRQHDRDSLEIVERLTRDNLHITTANFLCFIAHDKRLAAPQISFDIASKRPTLFKACYGSVLGI